MLLINGRNNIIGHTSEQIRHFGPMCGMSEYQAVAAEFVMGAVVGVTIFCVLYRGPRINSGNWATL